MDFFKKKHMDDNEHESRKKEKKIIYAYDK